ncbi:hypothetical protein SAMN05421642_103231 [Rhodococcoides kyotonense]|uniref:Amidophosphoribosyltransferase n=1 Tax=Rhodococcoides kyotonense TaxID=398843 RepID=A0A239FCK4_9NOCA|nr:hypothetical protein SAMN05421642_103231 [Rhodococcus kyotonensis]
MRLTDAQAELVERAGGYLRNTVRDERTCSTCTTLVYDGYAECYPCAHTPSGRLDLVAPLVYGIEGTQSATLLRHYKDSPSAATRQRLTRVVRSLLFTGLVAHEACIAHVVGQPVSMRLAIPSLSNRPGDHPFVTMAADMRATRRDGAQLVAASTATKERIVSGRQFELRPAGKSVTGHHVLLLDDTWTMGSRAQSASLTLRSAGASRVSVMVVGRWLKGGYRDGAAFIRSLSSDFNPTCCPATGGACPT